MTPKPLWLFGLVFVLVGLPQALLAEMEETPVANIELEREVHFVTPDEENVIVPPGFYTVEAIPGGMQLIEGITPHEVGEAFLIRAKRRPYEERVENPQIRSMPLDEDAHYLALLLPDGQVLESIGSYSGVRSRGKSVADFFFEHVPPNLRPPTTEEQNDLIARRDALLSAREEAREQSAREKAIREAVREQLAIEKEQAGIFTSEWKNYCLNRHSPNAYNANNHNSCCVQKYDSCLRVAKKKFTGSARRGFQQSCEAQNKACWRKTQEKVYWMRDFCVDDRNWRKIRVKSNEKCCSKMSDRCEKASYSVPKGKRPASLKRCQKAFKLCPS